MKKIFLRRIAVLLCAAVFVSSFFVAPVSAANGSGSSVSAGFGLSASAGVSGFLYKLQYNLLQKLVDALLGGVNLLIPSPALQNKSDYVSENFYKGSETFRDSAGQNAKWRLGYAAASVLTGNELDGNHFVGGQISANRKVATEIWDDMKIRVVALSDGVGGTVVAAALDAYGLANNDVREIRARLEQYAAANGIISINIVSLHQHSVIDTFGMNGDLKDALLLNPLKNLIGRMDIKNGKNPAFMENLFQVSVRTIKEACENMEPGSLYFGAADAKAYLRDKRAPYENDSNLNRLHFDPENPQSRDTMIVFWSAHCLGNGADKTQVTSDYPHYMEQIVNQQANANFMMVYGAGQSNTMNTDAALLGLPEGYTTLDKIKAYGEALAGLTLGISAGEETVVEPILNIRHTELFLPVDNQIIKLGRNTGLFGNTMLKAGFFRKEMVTEIGYMELGKNIAVAIIPGEIEPSLVYGGAFGAEESWSGQAWNYPSLQEIAGAEKKMLVCGVANDQIGYIVPDNDYVPMLAPESKSVEFVSLGKTTASRMITAFEDMVQSVR